MLWKPVNHSIQSGTEGRNARKSGTTAAGNSNPNGQHWLRTKTWLKCVWLYWTESVNLYQLTGSLSKWPCPHSSRWSLGKKSVIICDITIKCYQHSDFPLCRFIYWWISAGTEYFVSKCIASTAFVLFTL